MLKAGKLATTSGSRIHFGYKTAAIWQHSMAVFTALYIVLFVLDALQGGFDFSDTNCMKDGVPLNVS